MIRITALDHIVLNVVDVERSLAFYQRTLGLPAERVEAWRRGDVRFPSVRVSDSTIIDLVAAPESTGSRPNLAHFCLVSDSQDLDAVAEELKAAGVRVESEPAMRSGARGSGLSIYLRDPDDNLIELRTYQQASAS